MGWRESDSEKQNEARLSDSTPTQSNWVCRDQYLGTEKSGEFVKSAASLRFSLLQKKGKEKTRRRMKKLSPFVIKYSANFPQ